MGVCPGEDLLPEMAGEFREGKEAGPNKGLDQMQIRKLYSQQLPKR